MNYYGNSGGGSYLRHYRTKGSKNGYSKNPKYRPVGQQAKGQWVNGRYVYQSSSPLERGGYNQIQNDKLLIKNADKYKAMARGVAGDYNRASERAASLASINARKAAKGAQNDWQQQGNKQRAYLEAVNRFNSGSSRGVVNSFENPNKTYVHMQKKVGKPVKTSEYVKGTVVKGKKQSLIDKIKSKLKELLKKKK